MTGGQLDYDSPFGQTGTTSNWTPSATRSSRSTRRHARIELDDGPISLRAPQESALELARQREFEANGIDDQSLDFLLSRLGRASAALRERVDAARLELDQTEREAAALREQNEAATTSLRQLSDLCHESEQQARKPWRRPAPRPRSFAREHGPSSLTRKQK